MARIRVNRNSFSGGVFSKKAQANSNAEIYNYGLDICNNMIIDPLGGAYKRQGSRFAADLISDRVRLIEFKYAPGQSCMVLFTDIQIRFFRYNDGDIQESYIKNEGDDRIYYEDFANMSYFQFENKLYYYIARREGGPAPGFRYIERIAESDFDFDQYIGLRMSPSPKAPYTPSRLLRVIPHQQEEDKYFELWTLTEEGAEDENIFTEDDVGRKISFKYTRSYAEDDADVYWPEVVIEEVSLGKVKRATLTPASVPVTPDETITVREWFITAFDGGSEGSGRLGSPDTMTMFQGRLYLGKDTYVFASKRTSWPLCFAMGANEDDGLVQRITSGNMGQILWMYPIEKMIIGTADGIYLVGNTAQYAEAITNYNFVATKIGSMGTNSLTPVDAEGNIIFVGTDNKSVYELSLTQDGGYIISRINRLSEDLMKSSIIDHAWQQYPRKIYWTVMNDGALLGCTYDKEGAIRAWHEHTLGGKNTFVLQCETTKEKDIDILWLIVKREIGNKPIFTLEYLPPPFDGATDEVFEQQYTDCGTRIQLKKTIKDIHNSEAYRVNISYSEDEIDTFGKYIDIKGGKLAIGFIEDTIKLYINPALEYYSLDTTGFYVDAYGGNYTLSHEHDSSMMNAYFLFLCCIQVQDIKNIASSVYDQLVYVNVNLPALFTEIKGIIITIKDSGFEVLDNQIFQVYQPSAAGFYLADVLSGEPVSLELLGALNEDAQIYVGRAAVADAIQSGDPSIVLSENAFPGEDVDNAELHAARCVGIKGATKYNGSDFHLLLVDIVTDLETGEKSYWYGLYYNDKNKDDLKFVAYTYGYGMYDTLLENNGSVYFYFDRVSRGLIEHLIGQTVVYTVNGNYVYNKPFVLDNNSFEADGFFYLGRDSAGKGLAAVTMDIGLPYTAELKPVPLSGGSLFGSSEGCVGTQKVIVLMIYTSLGGQYGPSEPDDVDGTNKLLDIPYPWDDTVDSEKQLVTAAIKVPVWGNKDTTIRTVYVRSEEPLSFNILSIVQDVNVSDG